MGVAWVSVGVAAFGAISGASAAKKAQKSNDKALAAQETAAGKQQALAQEQWDFHKNTYLPQAMRQAEDQLAMSKQVTAKQLDNADFYQGLAKDNSTQAKKSWKFQDKMMETADDYSSARVGDFEAGRANADVESSFSVAHGAMSREAARRGADTGSAAYLSTMGDMYTQKALAGAGAQTNARVNARSKAENMVALAAGSGSAGFGTGLGAGALSNGAVAGAGQNNNASGAGFNAVASTSSGLFAGASSGFSQTGSQWGGAARTAQNSPMADFAGGLMSSGLKFAGANNTNFKMPSFPNSTQPSGPNAYPDGAMG